jgi:hypothetical protein
VPHLPRNPDVDRRKSVMTTQDTPRHPASTTHRHRQADPPMIEVRRVRALLLEHPRLHLWGMGTTRGITIEPAAYAELLTPSSRVRMAAALSWIETNLVPAPRNSKQARSTYVLKHRMERDTRLYVTNGEFISAALLSHISVDTSYFNPLLHAVLKPDTTPTGDNDRGPATAR